MLKRELERDHPWDYGVTSTGGKHGMFLDSWFPRDQNKTRNSCGLYSSKTSNKSDMSGVKSKTDWNNPRSEMEETLQTSFLRSSVSQNCKTTKHPSFLQLFPTMGCPSNNSVWTKFKNSWFPPGSKMVHGTSAPYTGLLSGLVPAPEIFHCKPLIHCPEETMECFGETFSKEGVQDSVHGDSIL